MNKTHHNNHNKKPKTKTQIQSQSFIIKQSKNYKIWHEYKSLLQKDQNVI